MAAFRSSDTCFPEALYYILYVQDSHADVWEISAVCGWFFLAHLHFVYLK